MFAQNDAADREASSASCPVFDRIANRPIGVQTRLEALHVVIADYVAGRARLDQLGDRSIGDSGNFDFRRVVTEMETSGTVMTVAES
jgi:hypothetical protein